MGTDSFSFLFADNIKLVNVTYESPVIISSENNDLKIIPTIKASFGNATKSSILFTVTLSGADGFVYYGIATNYSEANMS